MGNRSICKTSSKKKSLCIEKLQDLKASVHFFVNMDKSS